MPRRRNSSAGPVQRPVTIPAYLKKRKRFTNPPRVLVLTEHQAQSAGATPEQIDSAKSPSGYAWRQEDDPTVIVKVRGPP